MKTVLAVPVDRHWDRAPALHRAEAGLHSEKDHQEEWTGARCGASWRLRLLRGCAKQVQSGGTPHCKAHGGGRRCQHEGCLKSAAWGGTPPCKAHGGGRRCQEEDCTKSALGLTDFCGAHGGGRRCQEEDCFQLVARVARGSCVGSYCRPCLQASQTDATQQDAPQREPRQLVASTCQRQTHGAGRRCQRPGCTQCEMHAVCTTCAAGRCGGGCAATG